MWQSLTTPICVVLFAPFLACAYASPIKPAATSESPFWWFGWGKPETVISVAPAGEQLRISHRGLTGFTSVGSVRQSAEARAVEFCERRGEAMTPITEQISSSPHILGNFPRAEIVFVCTEKSGAVRPGAGSEDSYRKLLRLKQLLDAGAISQEEFDREKGEILAQ